MTLNHTTDTAYTDGLRDLAAMSHVAPEIAGVLRDCADQIDVLASKGIEPEPAIAPAPCPFEAAAFKAHVEIFGQLSPEYGDMQALIALAKRGAEIAKNQSIPKAEADKLMDYWYRQGKEDAAVMAREAAEIAKGQEPVFPHTGLTVSEALDHLAKGQEGEAPTVTITREVYDFLKGAGSLDGYFFGDKHASRVGLYWWRSFLRPASPAQPTAPTPPAERSERPTPLEVAREDYSREAERDDAPMTTAEIRRGARDHMYPITSRVSAIELDRAWRPE